MSLMFNRAAIYRGPLGEFVQRAEPAIEIGPLPVMAQLVTAFGVLIGRRVHTTGNGPTHYPNLFTLVVGKTSVGKGCSLAIVEQFCREVDPAYDRLRHGHPESAPGLIHLVSDGYESGRRGEVVSPAVTDKRCLLVCEEMRAIMTAKTRQGSSLSETLKMAWDGKDLENNTKEPIRATSPHIGLIGQITPEELQDTLPRLRTDRVNGFTNRFLVVAVERVRSLPFGGSLPNYSDLARILQERLAALDERGVFIDFAHTCRGEWEEFYTAAQNSDDAFIGLEGFVERLPPLVKRVAMIYAVADGATEIELIHLQSAIALCLACLESARGDLPIASVRSREEPLRDRLLKLMGGEWFSKTDAWKAVGGRGTKEELQKAIDALVANGDWEVREVVAENNKTIPKYRTVASPHCVKWSAARGFSGISDDDRWRWSEIYPGVDVDGEIEKANEWLKTHPDKHAQHARNPEGFITSWLGRAGPYVSSMM